MTHHSGAHTNFMALDVGSKRIGIAIASAHARLPHPHSTLPNDDNIWLALADLCHHETIGTLVVGLPRGLDGQETTQTAYCRDFADRALERLGVTVHLQDEALTSRHAELELAARKKSSTDRGEVDSLAATYILEDYLKEHHETR